MATMCGESLPGDALRAVEAEKSSIKAGTQGCPLGVCKSEAVSQVKVPAS